MDSFEINKLLGGLLGAAFVVFTIGIASDAIFASPAPHEPGYAIEAPEEDAGGSGPEVAEVEPVAVRLASADVDAGATVFRKCAACHTVDKGGANKVGPNLYDIVNRPVAGHEGFAYSGPMKEFAQGGSVVWDFDHLDQFLESPKGLVRGTAMTFAGVKKPDERADLLAYLHTLSDDPAPLPEAPAEESTAAADEGEPTAGDAEPAAAEEAAPAGDAGASSPAEAGAAEDAEQPAIEPIPAEGEEEPAAVPSESAEEPATEPVPAEGASETTEEADKPAAE